MHIPCPTGSKRKTLFDSKLINKNFNTGDFMKKVPTATCVH